MNKTTLTAALSIVAISSAVKADDVFEADFQASMPATDTDSTNVNAGVAIGDISGTFGTEVDIFQDDAPVGDEDQVLFVDRPPSGIFLDANFSDRLQLDGSVFSFKAGHRRTQGGKHTKDVTFTGYDAANRKSFEVVYQMDGSASLGYVANGNELTTVPAGGMGYMTWIGSTTGSFDASKLTEVTVTCGPTGYTITAVGATGGSNPFDWTSAELPYNGTATTISRVSITGSNQAAIWLDDLAASGTIETGAVVATNPTELSLVVGSPTEVVSGEVAVSYLEGVVPANVTITGVSITGQSHADAFTSTTSLPLTLTGPYPAGEPLSIEFDNTVAGLVEAETATGTLEIVWNEVGLVENHTTSVPVSAAYLEVHDGNILAVFDHTFVAADRTLAGIEATMTAGNRSNTQGSVDGTYGTLAGQAPVGTAGKIGNGDVPVFTVVITNNTGADATFESLNFDAGLMWPGGPPSMDIAITGDLTHGSIFFHDSFGVFNGQAGDYDDFDVDLTGLGDRVLADGESATFTFTFGAVDAGNEFISLIVDNIAFLGSGTAAAILTRDAGPIDSDWVSLPVTGGVSNSSQAIPMSYIEGDSGSGVSITNIVFSDETHAGAFGHDASFPIVLSTPDVISNVFNLTFDNSVAKLAPGEFAETTVTVEWNEGGASTRTLEFAAYGTRPSLASGNVIALFEREFLTADTAADGVVGWLGGGEGLNYYEAGSHDETFGSLGSPAASTEGGRWLVNNDEPVATMTLTNTTSNKIELTDLHFDVGRWYPGSPEDFTLSVSGDVTPNAALLEVTGLTELGWNGTDFDDFDVDLTGLADHTLDPGESVVFTYTFVAIPGNPYLGAFLDNLAVLGNVMLPPVLEIADNHNGTVTLTWDSGWTLQSADSPEGPWTDVAGSPVSPAVVSMGGAEEYYRVAE